MSFREFAQNDPFTIISIADAVVLVNGLWFVLLRPSPRRVGQLLEEMS